MVVNAAEKNYIHTFAWFRLVRTWGSLRCDDHRGPLPASLKMIAGTMSGTLARTKTSGVGRKREELYLFADSLAYLCCLEWLNQSYDLWMSIGAARDYFLVLPTASLDDVVHMEAQDADCQALSHALLRHLRLDGGRPLCFT